jgi:catabolite regulation protein CreA
MKQVAFQSTGRDINALLDPRFEDVIFFYSILKQMMWKYVNEPKCSVERSSGSSICGKQTGEVDDSYCVPVFGPKCLTDIKAAEVPYITGTG